MLRKVGLLVIFVNVVLSAALLLQNNLYFHTDIARDFLLVEDIVKTQSPTLIGPRSGGIPGVFHGPLWIYMQIPAFILGGGNPVAVGYFWLFLSILSIGIVYWVALKIFDRTTADISAIIFSVFSIFIVGNMFNPFGAVMLSPLFIYFLYVYLKNYSVRYLLAALFTLGTIIQFQMAFGVPLLILTGLYLLVDLWKKKKMSHLASFSILVLPLSSFIVFELRNNFFQIQSVLKYISGNEDHGKVTFVERVSSRLEGFFIDGFRLFPYDVRYLTLFVVIVAGFILYREHKKDSNFWKSFHGLYVYFYGGFWLMAFLFSGVIWSYYYWPFLPLTLIFLASLVKHKVHNRSIMPVLLVLMFLGQFVYGVKHVQGSPAFTYDAGSWAFNRSVAIDIFEQAPMEFGYYIYTPDQFGYTPRYAMNYVQRKYKDTAAVAFEKKAVTYILIAPPPDDRPDLDGVWWKENQVKITREPDNVQKYGNGFIVETYNLTKEEVMVESDPLILQDLHFR